MPLQRMDNVGIVVDDLPATIVFFRELGLELEGRATIEGDWAERVTGLRPRARRSRLLDEGDSEYVLLQGLSMPGQAVTTRSTSRGMGTG